jgi:hypothetical protein
MKKHASTSVVLGASTDKKTLNPRQKEFNRLTKKIAQTKEDIEQLDAVRLRIQQRAATELRPLLEKHDSHRVEMVRLLDRMQRSHKFNKTEIRKLKQLITSLSAELIQNGYEELKEIYNHYNPAEDFDTANAEAEAAELEMMKSMATAMYGIEFEEDADLDTPEKLREYIIEQVDAMHTKADQQAEKKRAQKPRTEKQKIADAKRAAQEEKRKLEEKKISQSVREVYMDLVKAFHPDREPDEAEKQRKTAILQRVTAAYEANNLLELLQLQLELERIDNTHLDSLADDKLRYFNKSLLLQLQELEEEADLIKMELMKMSNTPFFQDINPFLVERKFEASLKEVKKETRNLKRDLESFREPTVLKDMAEVPEFCTI